MYIIEPDCVLQAAEPGGGVLPAGECGGHGTPARAAHRRRRSHHRLLETQETGTLLLEVGYENFISFITF